MAEAANMRARSQPEHADADHAERDVGVLNERIGLPGEVADAELAGDHLGRDQRHPGDAHTDSQAGKDMRQRGGEIDLAEDRALARAQTLRRAYQHLVDHLHAVERVDENGEERAEEGDEDDALLVRRPQHDRHRHPGDGGDRPKHLGHRKDELADDTETAHHQAERHGDDGREQEPDQDPAAAQQRHGRRISDLRMPASAVRAPVPATAR